jgi:biopolymer transport protein ExbD
MPSIRLSDAPVPREGRGWAAVRASVFGALVVLLAWQPFALFVAHTHLLGSWRGLHEGVEILLATPVVWWSCVLFALPVGMAAWAVSLLVRPELGRRRAELRIVDRLWRQRVLAVSFMAIGLFGYGLAYRLLTIMSLFPLTAHPWPGLIVAEETAAWTSWDPLDLLLVSAVLLTVHSAVAWSRLVRDFGGRRLPGLVVFGAVVLGAAAVDDAHRFGIVGLPLPGGVVEAATNDPLVRASISAASSGDEGDVARLRALAETYLLTHGPTGELRRTLLDPVPAEPPTGDYGVARCYYTKLPVTRLFTGRGIPVDLTQDAPRAPAPGTVLEIPLGFHEVRRFDAVTGDFEGAMPRAAVPELREIGDWVVIKADALVPAQVVVPLLDRLRAAGVARVSLAAIPVDYARLPPGASRLVLHDRPSPDLEALADVPPTDYWPDRMVFVYRFTPPPDEPVPPHCDDTDGQHYYLKRSALFVVLPRAGTVPDLVRLRPSLAPYISAGDWGDRGRAAACPAGPYQSLIALIERAIVGGAGELHLGPEWFAEPDKRPYPDFTRSGNGGVSP